MDLSQVSNGWIAIVWFGLLGLCVGSFVNVVCHRLPIILKLGPYKDGDKLLELRAKHGEFTLSNPRSTCPCCSTNIKVYQNIPVVGWIMLRGKCSMCRRPISIKYPATELLFSAAFAGYVGFEGVWLAGLMTLPMMAIAYCLLVIRLQTKRVVAPLALAYVVTVVAQIALTKFGYSAYSG
ncbi:A24 family peptidase [Pseudomonas sp. MWU12-2323]|uniref:prepilin peptidase n=1 Tax=Pseudomonas sp. MWU12-2323 TaxID=2651296 RepID=UPI0015B4B5C2|nr:prepilin peptidase [Pseudomonas sp. MWU12-2323]